MFRKNRVINRRKLIAKLDAIGVPRSAYSLCNPIGNPLYNPMCSTTLYPFTMRFFQRNYSYVKKNGGYSLEYSYDGAAFILKKFENGEEQKLSGLGSNCFCSEAGACEALYILLGKEYGKESQLVFEEDPKIIKKMYRKLHWKEGMERLFAYDVSHELTDAGDNLSLQFDPKTKIWYLFFFERGGKSLLCFFRTETTALIELYNKVVKC